MNAGGEDEAANGEAGTGESGDDAEDGDAAGGDAGDGDVDDDDPAGAGEPWSRCNRIAPRRYFSGIDPNSVVKVCVPDSSV